MAHPISRAKGSIFTQDVNKDISMKRVYEDSDNFFMSLADAVSQCSEDNITKVGAVFVKNGEIISIGCNNLPLPGISWEDKKYYVIHAEMCAIFNHNHNMKYFENSTLYINHTPCVICSKALSQLKLKEVVFKLSKSNKEVKDNYKAGLDILKNISRKYGEQHSKKPVFNLV